MNLLIEPFKKHNIRIAVRFVRGETPYKCCKITYWEVYSVFKLHRDQIAAMIPHGQELHIDETTINEDGYIIYSVRELTDSSD